MAPSRLRLGRVDEGGIALPINAYAQLWHHGQTGLNLAVYRAYDADVGRWISRDPIGERGGRNVYLYSESDPINLLDFLGLEPVKSITVDQTNATVTVQYQNGTSTTYEAAVGNDAMFPGSDATGSGTVVSTHWGPESAQFTNTTPGWDTNKANPYGPVLIKLAGTDGRHIHGTNGPMIDGTSNLGGNSSSGRKFTHGCARVSNVDVVKLKKDVDEGLQHNKDEAIKRAKNGTGSNVLIKLLLSS